MGEWRCSSTILDLGTRWRRVVSFTPLPLYSQERAPQYTLARRLDGPQSLSGRSGVEKNLSPFGNRTPTAQAITRRYTGALKRNPYEEHAAFISRDISIKCFN
jgi:hypothetical protein